MLYGMRNFSDTKILPKPHRQLRVENLDLEESIRDQQQYRRRQRLRGGTRNESVDSSDDILHM